MTTYNIVGIVKKSWESEKELYIPILVGVKEVKIMNKVNHL